jgi:hypothetical protein
MNYFLTLSLVLFFEEDWIESLFDFLSENLFLYLHRYLVTVTNSKPGSVYC